MFSATLPCVGWQSAFFLVPQHHRLPLVHDFQRRLGPLGFSIPTGHLVFHAITRNELIVHHQLRSSPSRGEEGVVIKDRFAFIPDTATRIFPISLKSCRSIGRIVFTNQLCRFISIEYHGRVVTIQISHGKCQTSFHDKILLHIRTGSVVLPV